MEVIDYELVIDFRDLMDIKSNLDLNISIHECIKGHCSIYGIDPALTKNVVISAKLNESEKEFAEYILQSFRDYISRQKSTL